jgi:hypothetical protein
MQNYVDENVVAVTGVIKPFLQAEFRPENKFYQSAAYFIML